jgi:O-succinylbenzoic acid--CoA ligase
MDALSRLIFDSACSAERKTTVLAAAQDWLSGADKLTLFTSGSTGSPKTWTVQRSHVLESIRATARAFALGPETRSALAMDVAGTGGRLMLWRALELGMTLQVLPVGRHLTWVGPLDFLALVPQQALSLTPEQAAQVGTLLLGGAPVSPHEEGQLLKLFSSVYHGFGMTETLSHIALRLLGTAPHYTCLPGVSVTLDQGALVIDAPHRGVHLLRTTDAADVHNPSSFTWLGRLDGAILSGGKKIFPESIDQAIAAAYPEHPTGFAGSIPDPEWGEALVWYSVPLSDAERHLLLQAFQTLESWQRPKRILEGELPLTASGKWRRKSKG